MRGMHPPTSHFQKCLDVGLYNFSIISNLFNSNQPCALSTVIENVRTKCIMFGEALRIRVKKFKQNLAENYSKSTKLAITACKFSGGACPRTTLEPFLFHNQLQISSAEKIRLKKLKIMPSHFKISRYATVCGRDDLFFGRRRNFSTLNGGARIDF